MQNACKRYPGVMAVNITIRNVPDAVRDELAERAMRTGRSMQEFLVRELTTLASKPSAAEAVRLARLNAETLPSMGLDHILDDLRADRRA